MSTSQDIPREAIREQLERICQSPVFIHSERTSAFLRYTVEEVLTEASRSPDIAYPFCVPTFLDSTPNSQFFPTPKELPAGAPMALFEISSDDELIAEVLHSRLTYRRHHIAKLGEIASDGPTADFRTVRNNHLAALQLAAVRDNFGEEL